MRQSRFTPEQILQALRQAESGTPMVSPVQRRAVVAWAKQTYRVP